MAQNGSNYDSKMVLAMTGRGRWAWLKNESNYDSVVGVTMAKNGSNYDSKIVLAMTGRGSNYDSKIGVTMTQKGY